MSTMTVTDRADVLLLLLFAPGKSGQDAEPVRGRTRLVKLLYLLKRTLEEKGSRPLVDTDKFYQFYPYRFGPFTREVFDDLEFFRNLGIIRVAPDQSESADLVELAEANESNWEPPITDEPEAVKVDTYNEVEVALTDKGREIARGLWDSLAQEHKNALVSIKREYGAVPLTQLLRYVYRKYPESALQTERDDLR
jgi:hypothetical protein